MPDRTAQEQAATEKDVCICLELNNRQVISPQAATTLHYF